MGPALRGNEGLAATWAGTKVSSPRKVKSGDGIVSKGWFVILNERKGAVSNLKTGGKGVVYGCLVEDEAFEGVR
ncbi:MAG: hypothetical protein OEM15_01005 [Myxococcales bacterium]|nr:hypothetical protein [Myxococcales bacterium]MDH3483782.1 hypothetical protein [Myxococcales bacterium]